MNISVLLSVYWQTEPEEFSSCLDSIAAQTLLPTELVVVLDGRIQQLVEETLSQFKKQCEFPVNVLNFPNNRGLGAALADGLEACQYELVARVDTDDISVAERFRLQHDYFLEHPGFSVVGGQLEEIYDADNKSQSLIRSIPLELEQINQSSRYRNPLNHPTVMFRRDDILDVGNYQTILWFEDYYLWARLILQGYKIQNLDRVLVQAQADAEYFQRRGGWQYLKQEYRLSQKFREVGFQNFFQSLKFISTRFLFRIVPLNLRTWLYFRFLRGRPTESSE